jgi:hypothetical protein
VGQPSQAALLLLFGSYRGTDLRRACAGPTRSMPRPRSPCGHASRRRAPRRAAMVSNLLVMTCSDHDATPVFNPGTLYN